MLWYQERNHHQSPFIACECVRTPCVRKRVLCSDALKILCLPCSRRVWRASQESQSLHLPHLQRLFSLGRGCFSQEASGLSPHLFHGTAKRTDRKLTTSQASLTSTLTTTRSWLTLTVHGLVRFGCCDPIHADACMRWPGSSHSLPPSLIIH